MRTKRARHGVALALVLLVTAVAALTVTSTAVAAPGDNVKNARLCLRGGWQGYQTTSGVRFRGLFGCVLYALRGGALVPVATTPPPPPPPPPPPVEEPPPPAE